MSKTVEYTAESYHQKLDQACQDATSGPGWDERFLQALQRQGLKLVHALKPPSGAYQGGLAFTAPIPFDRKSWFEGVPNSSVYVVWNDQKEQSMNIPTVEHFLKKEYVMMIAEVHYGRGFYVGLIPTEYSELIGSIENNLRGGDVDYINTTSLFVTPGVYPLVIGDTIPDGFAKLEALMNPTFEKLGYDYYEYINDVLRTYKPYANCAVHILELPVIAERTKQLKTLLEEKKNEQSDATRND